MAASPLFLSSTPALRSPSSPFKGNVSSLRPSLCSIPTLKTTPYQRRHLVFVNKAAAAVVGAPSASVRFRLNNLGPQPGSRKKGKRKGRGIAAGQGNSCGFGMRGQKSEGRPSRMKIRGVKPQG